MKKLTAAAAALCFAALAGSAYGGGWSSTATFRNQVASSPTTGGGYPVPAGVPPGIVYAPR